MTAPDRMRVVACPGVRVPRELDPRTWIDEHTPVDVPRSAYYLRRIADGDLREVAVKPAPARTRN